jgi:hypothetical protein
MSPFNHPTLGPLHLGRPRVSPRTHKTMAKAFRVHDFLSTLPVPPATLDLTGGITSWGMMLNSDEGDCTVAECGHAVQCWTAAAGSEITVPDSAIQTAYEKVGGYVPGDASTDNGAMITDVLEYFRTTGIDGHSISAHAEVNLTQLRVSQALNVFGALDFGVQLPASAQNQVGSRWSVVGDGKTGDSAPGSWGGHSIALVSYDAQGVKFVTWGALQDADWDWVMLYADEAHACLSPEWHAPVDVSQLSQDLNDVGT